MRLTISCDAKLDDYENGKDDMNDGNKSESHVGRC
jgi:hypothetical protein